MYIKKENKIFVLDTNVILHDASCIHYFEDNDIIIPTIVLEELDDFKRGNDEINFNAREFLRTLDILTENIVDGEIPELGDGRGSLKVVVNHRWHPDIHNIFIEDSPDHRIINCAYSISKNTKNRKVILVSKDSNVRLKARSLGLFSEDYSNDKVEKNVNELYTGVRTFENVESKYINMLYDSKNMIESNNFDIIDKPLSNENYILKNGIKSALATYDPFNKGFKVINKISAFGITPRNAEQSFGISILKNEKIKLATLTGKAGTGKTLLALASALESRSKFRQIYLARPIIPLSNKDLGFLPGDLNSKLDPYMQPLFDNLDVIKHNLKPTDNRIQIIKRILDEEKLFITPLSYIRGRSLQNIYLIVDEAQNLTPHEIKTVITRAGEGTKVVFTGDIHQIDHPYLDSQSNGLAYIIEKMKNQNLYAHINLAKGERSELSEIASNLL
ncbi:MAG: ribonuclease [Candidatus Marinimicrobia bacterium]|nr:ribonuclease [Candidatus Neomarinimicrobiota bacterium]